MTIADSIFRIRKEGCVYHYDFWPDDGVIPSMELVKSIQLRGCHSVELWFKRSVVNVPDFDLEEVGLSKDDFFIVLRTTDKGIGFIPHIIDYYGRPIELSEDGKRSVDGYPQVSGWVRPVIDGEEYTVLYMTCYTAPCVSFAYETRIKIKEEEKIPETFYGMRILKENGSNILTYIVGSKESREINTEVVNSVGSFVEWNGSEHQSAIVRKEVEFGTEPFELVFFVTNAARRGSTSVPQIMMRGLYSDDYFFVVTSNNRYVTTIDPLGNTYRLHDDEIKDVNDYLRSKGDKFYIRKAAYKGFRPHLKNGKDPTQGGYWFSINMIEKIIWE